MISQGFAVSFLLPLVFSVVFPTLFLPFSSLSPRASLIARAARCYCYSPSLSDYSSTRFISPRGFQYRATEHRKLERLESGISRRESLRRFYKGHIPYIAYIVNSVTAFLLSYRVTVRDAPELVKARARWRSGIR